MRDRSLGEVVQYPCQRSERPQSEKLASRYGCSPSVRGQRGWGTCTLIQYHSDSSLCLSVVLTGTPFFHSLVIN